MSVALHPATGAPIAVRSIDRIGPRVVDHRRTVLRETPRPEPMATLERIRQLGAAVGWSDPIGHEICDRAVSLLDELEPRQRAVVVELRPRTDRGPSAA